MKAKRLQRIAGNAIAAIVSLIMFIPVYLVIVNALKSKAQASSMGIDLPTSLHWENFLTVIERGKLLQTFFMYFQETGRARIASYTSSSSWALRCL
jgi:raffinose/stachyose/melibiose transport system permease protein